MLFLRASNHQLVDKMNFIEFTVLKAFTSEFRLRTNPVKAFNGMCVRLTSMFSRNLVERVNFSDSRVVYKFFLINNIELIRKCSFVRCLNITSHDQMAPPCFTSR